MSGPSQRRGGGAARYALPLMVLLLMTGVVLAVNPGHYGRFWTAVGVGMAVVGGILTVRLFRAAGAGKPDAQGRKTDREEEEPEGGRPADG